MSNAMFRAPDSPHVTTYAVALRESPALLKLATD